ncbi:hypothetical protein EGW08_017476 [Elysia chlorotica]|uniref:Uncharacterized protein n=1 Tax=Elysia chlorotica TaxID=188477 RepID=A0A433SZP8_ELYCH|nr:hypothetical protein EGW08_017476 [Elysia chlorotica]
MNILHMMASFRSNLFAMYRGDFKVIPPPSSKSAVWLCTGCIKYSGFQVGFLVWGYIVMWLILFAITFILSMMIDGYLAELVEEIKTICQTWPGVLVAMVLLVLQGLLARFVFLQGSASFLRLDNRNSYFIFAYFMFFYNIFLGVVSCLLRILKAVVIGAVFLARLDSSTLPRRFEAWDSGLSAYTGFVHMEAAHTHPVLNVFVRLLVSLNRTKRLDGLARALDVHITSNDSDINDSQDDQSCPRRNPVGVTAKFKWFLVYTLLHNPQIRLYRQGYIQSVKKARQDGLRVPISDRPIVQFDLTQLRTAQGESDQAIPSPGQDATVSGPATHLVHVPSSVVVSGGTSDADDIDVDMIEDLEDIEDSSGFLRDPMGSGDTELLMPV